MRKNFIFFKSLVLSIQVKTLCLSNKAESICQTSLEFVYKGTLSCRTIENAHLFIVALVVVVKIDNPWEFTNNMSKRSLNSILCYNSKIVDCDEQLIEVCLVSLPFEWRFGDCQRLERSEEFRISQASFVLLEIEIDFVFSLLEVITQRSIFFCVWGSL